MTHLLTKQLSLSKRKQPPLGPHTTRQGITEPTQSDLDRSFIALLNNKLTNLLTKLDSQETAYPDTPEDLKHLSIYTKSLWEISPQALYAFTDKLQSVIDTHLNAEKNDLFNYLDEQPFTEEEKEEHLQRIRRSIQANHCLIIAHQDGDAQNEDNPFCNYPPLMGAVIKGHTEVAALLLRQGADISAGDENGDTALYTAIHCLGIFPDPDTVDIKLDMIKLLLSHKASLTEIGSDGLMPIQLATEIVQQPCLQMLLKHGADPNSQDADGWTPLHEAVSKPEFDLTPRRPEARCIAVLETLLTAGADPNASDKHGITPLHVAVFKGQLNYTERLLSNGANPNLTTTSRPTPYHDITKYRPRLGKEALSVIDEGTTPLHIAVATRRQDIVELLVARGADTNSLIQKGDFQGYSPLHIAIICKDLNMIRFLLMNGAHATIKAKQLPSPQAPNHIAITPLFLAAKINQQNIAELLVTHGADTNTLSKDGDYHGLSPLHMAITKGDFNMVKFLLMNGADATIKIESSNPQTLIDEGTTPLHLAVRNNQKDIAELLMTHGADKTTPIPKGKYQGYSPLHMAIINRNVNMTKLLTGSSSLDDLLPYLNEFVFHYTMLLKAATPLLIRRLIETGFNPKFNDPKGNTPLHLAVQYGQLALVKSLFPECMDIINTPNKVGISPLGYSLMRGHNDIYDYFCSYTKRQRHDSDTESDDPKPKRQRHRSEL